MRLLFVILLIALVPLRSWAGDAMAIRMAHGVVDSGHSTVARAASTASMHDDCAGGHHGAPASQATALASAAVTAAADAAQDHCTNCASCQACFTVALMGLPSVVAPLIPHNSPPHTGLKSFTSADVVLGHKPPIS